MRKAKKNRVDEDIISTGEDNVEDVELADTETTVEAKIKKTRDSLKQCEIEKRQLHEDLQRARAEFLNSKKRLADQLEIEKERSLETHVSKLLPLCDSFDMAMSNVAAWEEVDETWRKGVEGIRSQLYAILTAYNVQALEPVGEEFNPQLHEAVGSTDHKDFDADTVVEVVQKGYQRNGKVIRPAKVILQS